MSKNIIANDNVKLIEGTLWIICIYIFQDFWD